MTMTLMREDWICLRYKIMFKLEMSAQLQWGEYPVNPDMLRWSKPENREQALWAIEHNNKFYNLG